MSNLRNAFEPEFHELVDELELWLLTLSTADWNQQVIYAIDMKPEFERGEAPSRMSFRLMSKEQALAFERSAKKAGSTSADKYIELIQSAQLPNRVWLFCEAASGRGAAHELRCIPLTQHTIAGDA